MTEETQVLLIGQPNVGKSCLFSMLTGIGVVSSNYPGTTVEFSEGTVVIDGKTFRVYDLPGTYSLSTNSNDEKIVIDTLRGKENDIVIVVIDATNPEPGIVLMSEVLELGLPLIVVLNKYDLAAKKYDIDVDGLSGVFGVPFIPTSSRTKEGMDVLLNAISTGKARISSYRVPYDSRIVKCIKEIQNADRSIKWGIAVKLLENVNTIANNVFPGIESSIVNIQRGFREIHGEAVNVYLARDRYENAHIITTETIRRKFNNRTCAEKLSEITINPATGVPILVLVLALTLACVVFVGGYLSEVIDRVYSIMIEIFFPNLGCITVEKVLIKGIVDGVGAILEIIIPYIVTFYIILGVLEDTGYMPRAVVLLDRMMYKVGLHGNGFIPMVVGLGCNVPAILATRSIKSRKERVILCTLICMAIPCSSQLAIIAGVTGRFSGYIWSLVIISTLIITGVCVGVFLNKRLPYEASHLAMELPELEFPKFSNIIRKMWMRTSDFFMLAVPLLILGSVIIDLLFQLDFLMSIVQPMSWMTVSLLGLPATTIVAFVAGIIRKEMAYGMLAVLAEAQSVDLASFMSSYQYVIFGVVMAIYLPCLAAMAALYREFGIKYTIVITISSIVIALTIGSGFNGIFSLC